MKTIVHNKYGFDVYTYYETLEELCVLMFNLEREEGEDWNKLFSLHNNKVLRSEEFAITYSKFLEKNEDCKEYIPQVFLFKFNLNLEYSFLIYSPVLQNDTVCNIRKLVIHPRFSDEFSESVLSDMKSFINKGNLENLKIEDSLKLLTKI